jgi:nitric oxide reductase subunit B
MHRHWWIPLLLILTFGASGVLFMGVKTYQEAPPIPEFAREDGSPAVPRELILQGQAAFQRLNLMDYGSMFGDGANRGPDFTADALRRLAAAMREHHLGRAGDSAAGLDPASRAVLAAERTRREIKANRYDPATGRTVLSAAQAAALPILERHYAEMFAGRGPEAFHPPGYVSDPGDVRALTAFFFWGAWVCGAERPGHGYSYTQNWPYDEWAGNTPTRETLLWSAAGLFALSLALGLVLFIHGRGARAAGGPASADPRPPLGVEGVEGFRPTPSQRATYKFFAVAALLFVLQIVAGVLAVHDFVGFTTFFGVDLSRHLPITVTRGWHLVLALLWITACWMGGSLFILPQAALREPKGQASLVNLLFGLLVVVAAGSMAGIFLGPMGFLGDRWRLLGSQGWEFMELGRLWQALLFLALCLWAFLVVRGALPALRSRRPHALPYWLVYSVIAVAALFLSSFVATPRTNFVIADFWRWMVIHMWAECFLEVFTTVVVAYFLVLMRLVSETAAARTVYLATLLFLGSGILGISHNFYWSAKPVVTLALGSVFSTLQVVPLFLLTLEAWKVYRMPRDRIAGFHRIHGGERPRFGQSSAFLFLLGVNFWNFLGAGAFGLLINLPIVNYYEHGTYLTVNHGHSAFMGVYGNLSLAALVFCSRYLIRAGRWSDGLVRAAFWSLNIGLALMALLHLFPAGVAQLTAVVKLGYQAARSQGFIQSDLFQTLTWMRILGGSLFFLGGVLPLAGFLAARWTSLKEPEDRSPGAQAAAAAGLDGAVVPAFRREDSI